VLGPVLLPEFRDPQAGRLDLISAAMSLAAVLLVIYGLKQISENGLEWLSALSIVAGLAVGFVFLRRQQTLRHPLIDIRLFRLSAFSASLAIYLVGTFVAFGSFVFMAQYLQLVVGLSPLEAGLWTLPWAIAFILGSNLTPLIVRRFSPASVMAGGLALTAAGLGVLTQVDNAFGLAVLVTGSVIYSLGLAPVFTLATDMIVGSAPPERAGAAAAISETSSEFGGALGIAILGSIGTAVYRSVMVNALPEGISSEASEAVRGTLGGAVAVAEQLPAQLGAVLLGPAREAFVQAFELTAAISAVITLAAAIGAAVLLRHIDRDSVAKHQPEMDGAGPTTIGEMTTPIVRKICVKIGEKDTDQTTQTMEADIQEAENAA
jgi:MFS transporter, DHA2 family, multidrug resistance protein